MAAVRDLRIIVDPFWVQRADNVGRPRPTSTVLEMSATATGASAVVIGRSGLGRYRHNHEGERKVNQQSATAR
jgi:hypothetical protein